MNCIIVAILFIAIDASFVVDAGPLVPPPNLRPARPRRLPVDNIQQQQQQQTQSPNSSRMPPSLVAILSSSSLTPHTTTTEVDTTEVDTTTTTVESTTTTTTTTTTTRSSTPRTTSTTKSSSSNSVGGGGKQRKFDTKPINQQQLPSPTINRKISSKNGTTRREMGISTVVNAQLFDARGRSVQSIMVRVPIKNANTKRKSATFPTNPGGFAVRDRVVSDETVPITFGGNRRQQTSNSKTPSNNQSTNNRQQQQVLVFKRSRR